jgi:5-methylcytosine-specific restriction enzyme A
MQAPPRPCRICRQPVKKGGLCAFHLGQYDSRRDRRRPSATQRGYGQDHRELFRKPVLKRDKYCPCGALATVADHYPLSRRELVAAGLDPNNPEYGRGLCKPCHDSYTGLTKK